MIHRCNDGYPDRDTDRVDAISFDDLELDGQRIELRSNGRAIPTSPQEWRLIGWMMRHPDTILSHWSIANAIWTQDAQVHDDIPTRAKIRSLVYQLRKKLVAHGVESPQLLARNQAGYGLLRARLAIAA